MLDLFKPTYADLPAGLCRALLRSKRAGGLTLREALIMHAVLVAEAPLTMTELSTLIHAPQPSVTRCVARLELLGFITKQPRAELNRRRLVATPKGKELLQ